MKNGTTMNKNLETPTEIYLEYQILIKWYSDIIQVLQQTNQQLLKKPSDIKLLGDRQKLQSDLESCRKLLPILQRKVKDCIAAKYDLDLKTIIG